MTEKTQLFVEKYGLLTMLATVISVVLIVFIQLAVIAKWTGAIEEQAKATCRRLEVLETFQATAPARFTTREEHTDIKERFAILRESQQRSREEILGAINRLAEKVDRHLEDNKAKGAAR